MALVSVEGGSRGCHDDLCRVLEGLGMNSVATDRVTSSLVMFLWQLQAVKIKRACRWDMSIAQPKHSMILHYHTMLGGSRWYVY